MGHSGDLNSYREIFGGGGLGQGKHVPPLT